MSVYTAPPSESSESSEPSKLAGLRKEAKDVLGALITEKGIGKVTNITQTARGLAKISGLDEFQFKIPQEWYTKMVENYMDQKSHGEYENVFNVAILKEAAGNRNDIELDTTISEEVKEDPELLAEWNKRFENPSLRFPNKPRVYEDQRVAVMDTEYPMQAVMSTTVIIVAGKEFFRAFPKQIEENKERQYKFKVKIVKPDKNNLTCRWRIIIRW